MLSSFFKYKNVRKNVQKDVPVRKLRLSVVGRDHCDPVKLTWNGRFQSYTLQYATDRKFTRPVTINLRGNTHAPELLPGSYFFRIWGNIGNARQYSETVSATVLLDPSLVILKNTDYIFQLGGDLYTPNGIPLHRNVHTLTKMPASDSERTSGLYYTSCKVIIMCSSIEKSIALYNKYSAYKASLGNNQFTNEPAYKSVQVVNLPNNVDKFKYINEQMSDSPFQTFSVSENCADVTFKGNDEVMHITVKYKDLTGVSAIHIHVSENGSPGPILAWLGTTEAWSKGVAQNSQNSNSPCCNNPQCNLVAPEGTPFLTKDMEGTERTFSVYRDCGETCPWISQGTVMCSHGFNFQKNIDGVLTNEAPGADMLENKAFVRMDNYRIAQYRTSTGIGSGYNDKDFVFFLKRSALETLKADAPHFMKSYMATLPYIPKSTGKENQHLIIKKSELEECLNVVRV